MCTVGGARPNSNIIFVGLHDDDDDGDAMPMVMMVELESNQIKHHIHTHRPTSTCHTWRFVLRVTKPPVGNHSSGQTPG